MTKTALTRLASDIQTLAAPTSEVLLAARALVGRDARVQAAFIRAKGEGWAADKLVEAIRSVFEETLQGTPEQLQEAALYLADEYLQGGDGILLVSRETGKALARITEEDIWQPSPVRREDGSLVNPLPRLRPDLEGFLVQWAFDRSREQSVLGGLSSEQMSAPAAKVLTHGGRKGLVERLRSEMPQLDDVRGTAGQFLSYLTIQTDDVVVREGLIGLPRQTAFARTRMKLSDLRATNLRFDIWGHLRGVLATLWSHEIARTIVLSCPNEWASKKALGQATFWLGLPTGVAAQAGLPCLALDTETATGLCGPLGILQVHTEGYRVADREVLDGWEVAACLDFTLWVDWNVVLRCAPANQPPSVTVIP